MYYCFLASFLQNHKVINNTIIDNTNNTSISTNDILKTLLTINPIFQD